MASTALDIVRPRREAIITRPIARKKKLGFGEWVWVWNAPLWFLFNVFLMGAGITVAAAGSGVSAGVTGGLMIVGSFIGGGFSIYLWQDRCKEDGNRYNQRDSKANFLGRKFNCFAERSRKRAPHAHERQTRLREIARDYPQYSVHVGWDKSDIVMWILEHTHWYGSKYHATYANIGYGGQLQSDDLFRNPNKGEIRIPDPTPELVEEKRQQAEEYAAQMERDAYESRVKKLKIERLALDARRPPSGLFKKSKGD